MTWNPLDLPGGPFLLFYLVALAVAHVAGKVIARSCRSAHAVAASTAELLPLEAAYLAGGPERAIDAALVGMLHHDMIEVQPGGGGFVAGKTSSANLTGLQADLYREIVRKSGAIDSLRRIRSVPLRGLETRLANAGLLLEGEPGERHCVQWSLALPVLCVIALGIAKVFVGLARGKPVLFLVAFLVISAAIFGVKFFKLPLRSARGEATLKKLTGRNAALEAMAKRRSADLDEASLILAAGLFGASLMASGDLLWMKPGFATQRGGDSSGSGCSSSGGCGGGGGGGCGGCGG